MAATNPHLSSAARLGPRTPTDAAADALVTLLFVTLAFAALAALAVAATALLPAPALFVALWVGGVAGLLALPFAVGSLLTR
ncbi:MULTISPECIES: hypothetical protein [unclassified Haladaptatus]|uniref:hypothetical protein n=1 Tax=unclassified Haladaptatus TaxID=2622732 RepID=UPI0023E8390D|nr:MULTISPECIES: hypothetical protein [unclassified Haladaptatus]